VDLFGRKSKRKYCKYCRYYNKQTCNAPENLEIKRDSYSSFLVNKNYPVAINKNNDCKFYKQKWWRYIG